MPTRGKKIVQALVALLAIVSIGVAAWVIGENVRVAAGATEGFGIDGTYTVHEGLTGQMSFHGDDGWRWQMVNSEGDVTDGRFEATADPNVYLLFDSSGKSLGIAHLACASRSGDAGTLYVLDGKDVTRYDKTASVPGFIVASEKAANTE